ncbi:MAG: hypothetical protein Q8K63_00660 [Acidimicrobiales bacterium]|nr:hypothetical protein [Acidimicrobiales bacterium]
MQPERIAGADYLNFDADNLDLAAVARLSVLFALFERRGDALVPVELPAVDRYDDDLLTIPRYTGKTNEQFTKLLLNVTVPDGGPVTVLDPMAGRGTTLHQAVMYGWDAVGVEIDKKDCEAYRTFFATWLKNKRLPHKAKLEKHRWSVEFAADRPALDAGHGRTAVMINGDSRGLDAYVKKNSVDAIVTDLPYGVRHGSEGERRDRSPLGLLDASLDSWTRVVRPGGAIGVAFNTFTCPRVDLIGLFESYELEVFDQGAYRQLEHRVDQSINRDVVVSRRR